MATVILFVPLILLALFEEILRSALTQRAAVAHLHGNWLWLATAAVATDSGDW